MGNQLGKLLDDGTARGQLILDILAGEETHALGVILPQLIQYLLVRAVLAPQGKEQHTGCIGVTR